MRKQFSLKTLKIGGVNEHFNFPFRYGIEAGHFADKGIDLQWQDVKGGTGEMIHLLHEGELDFCVLLTEGLLIDALRNDRVRLIQFHVSSPLHWGIHVHRDSGFSTPAMLEGKTFAVSRMGSGSHLMAEVMKMEHHWKESPKFNIVHSLEGGLSSLRDRESDVFLWEIFTTAPFLDQYHLNCIGFVPTPWPSFALCVRKEIAEEQVDLVKELAKTAIATNVLVRNLPDLSDRISRRYALSPSAVAKWLGGTEWNTTMGTSEKQVSEILHQLSGLQLIQANEIPTHAKSICAF